MAKEVKLKVGNEVATMVLLEDKAPNTCKKLLECLPIKSQLIHAKFAGSEFMVKVPFFSDMENPATRQDQGNVCLNDPSQTMCVFYDSVPGMGPCTLFAKIVGNLEGIQKEARKAWKKGGALVEIYE
jgi:hypothetical protein